MDKIQKFLKRLNKKERVVVLEILSQLEHGSLEELDVKKLKGEDYVFRIRKGDIRIIVSRDGARFRVIRIERRNDTTY